MNEDRSASFVELFFDLVFVFGVTQVAASIHGHLDWPTLGKAAIVLMLLWWAWSQFTWAAGNADFDDLRPRVVLLGATAATFILATSVQGAMPICRIGRRRWWPPSRCSVATSRSESSSSN